MATIKSFPNNADVYVGAEHPMKWLYGRTSGVFAAAGNCAVTALATPAMAVAVSDGVGWLSTADGDGIAWWNDSNKTSGTPLQLSVDTADSVKNRIDRVIVEWSLPNFTALPELKILKGAASVGTPSAPALTNDASVRQISLARISVPAGASSVTSAMITDERLDESVCGLVAEPVEIDTTVINAQAQALFSEIRALIDALTVEAVPSHAFTHLPGGDDELEGFLPLNGSGKADISYLPVILSPQSDAMPQASNGYILLRYEA